MFTILSNTRNSNLYLIAALAVMIVALLTIAIAPTISSTPNSAANPVSGLAEQAGSDYFQRHPELNLPGAAVVELQGDFFLRHPEWTGSVASVAVPVTGSSATLDYFQRHPELGMPAVITADTADYFIRHPELRPSVPATDLSDYFLRH